MLLIEILADGETGQTVGILRVKEADCGMLVPGNRVVDDWWKRVADVSEAK